MNYEQTSLGMYNIAYKKIWNSFKKWSLLKIVLRELSTNSSKVEVVFQHVGSERRVQSAKL